MIEILMVEDDLQISELLTKFLLKYGMGVTSEVSPLKALNLLEEHVYDIIILDLTLPEMDGIDLCKQIRAAYETPIIISSARDDLSDKVLGFDAGADDYLPKPYEPRELVARIQNALKHTKKTVIETNKEENGLDFTVNEEKMQIRQDGKLLDLTLAEYEILKLLLDKRGSIVTRTAMLESSESINWDSNDRTIDVLVGRIRKKIDASGKLKLITTIRGAGYKFTG